MIKKLIVFFMLLSTPCFAAEYYCDLTLSGDGAGTTGDPWQLSQAINDGNVSGGDTVYFRGAGGDLLFSTDVHTIGSAGNPVIYTQWVGEAAASLESIVWNDSGNSYVKFSNLTIDPGETGTFKLAVELNNGAGDTNIDGIEVTFENCTIYAHRYNGYSGGDYYPYYIKETGAQSSFTAYGMYFREVPNATVVIQNCDLMHGYRTVAITNNGASSTFLIDGCTFNRAGEDAIETDTPNVTISNCVFAEDEPMSAAFTEWYWTGSPIGTWAGEEGATVTQDTTNASGIYVGQTGGKIYLLADDENNILVRTAQYAWRLDSDPTNVYWLADLDTTVDVESSGGQKVISIADTVGFLSGDTVVIDDGNANEETHTVDSISAGVSLTLVDNLANTHAVGVTVERNTVGDNAHNDCISTQSAWSYNLIIEQNIFHGSSYNGIGGQVIKIATGADAIIRNNIIKDFEGQAYAILLENADATIINNIILANSGDTHGIRTYGGTHTITNNILSGGVYSSGTVTASNNIFKTSSDPWSGSNSLTSQDFSDSPSGNNRYFMDYANGDYRPYNVDSPQINAGTTGPDTDFLGVTRPQLGAYDIGPYEWYIPASQLGITDSGISHGNGG